MVLQSLIGPVKDEKKAAEADSGRVLHAAWGRPVPLCGTSVRSNHSRPIVHTCSVCARAPDRGVQSVVRAQRRSATARILRRIRRPSRRETTFRVPQAHRAETRICFWGAALTKVKACTARAAENAPTVQERSLSSNALLRRFRSSLVGRFARGACTHAPHHRLGSGLLRARRRASRSNSTSAGWPACRKRPLWRRSGT